jgi:uncharacterized protein
VRRRPGGRLAAGAALIAALAGVAAAAPAAAARELPPPPARWVSDRAGVLSAAGAAAVDQKLEAFEKEQGTQILVAIFRQLPPDEALEDWTVRVAQSWRVGRARQDDGAVLFAFVDDRQLRLEVGYGLEGALTDLESKVILDEVLVPRLRAGDWDGGIAAAADAILQAVRGEYRPLPGADPSRPEVPVGFLVFIIFVVLVFVILMGVAQRRSGGRSGGFGGSSGGGWSGGSSGGFGGFSGGGFSGGGGSFGGGGASSRW